jgi:3-phenylpropionate/trans-cinnamate dioxygenase ferredoxin subunit
MSLKFAATLAELTEDEPLGTTIEGRPVALYLVEGEVFATHNVCTHQFALLSDGYLEDGCIECPLHQARFDVRTGAALSAPACEPVKTYPVVLQGNDIFVDFSTGDSQ